MRIIKIISVLVCLFMVALPVITNMCLQVQTLVQKERMMERLEKESLETIHLTRNELHWYKEGKELVIGDALFDVKNITATSQGYIVEGLFDEKEKELKKNIEGLIAETEEQQEENFFSFLQLVYHPQAGIHYSKEIAYDPAKHYPLYSEAIADHSYPVILPPPRVIPAS